MTTQEAINALGELIPDGKNIPASHAAADEILLAWIENHGGGYVVDSYRIASERCLGFECA